MTPATDQTKQEELIVSFCIPVYNNAEAAEKIVRGILCSDSTRFEVIVSDDASTDDAEERLSRIHDSRFRYFRNEKNLGAHKNWEHALELGHGEYLYIVMGRDKINGECIDRLIEILEYAHENNITLLQDGYDTSKDIQVYEGINAMIRFLEIIHPTGTIFDRKIFASIPDRTRYFEIADMYPENYVRHDMLLKGRGASVMSGIFQYPSMVIDREKIKSTVEYGKDIYEMYYSPKRRTRQIHEIIDMIENDSEKIFSIQDKDKFFRIKFTELLDHVSIKWRRFCSTQEKQAHYGQPVMKISTLEMIRNVFTAYRETLRHLNEKGICTPSKQKIMKSCVTKMTVKALSRLVLEPFRIWEILGFIKRVLKG